jgi:hypothetical protein
MGLEVTRIYKNATEDTLRVDKIQWTPTSNTLNTGTAMRTYSRRVYTSKLFQSNITDREVAIIQIITNADVIDTSSPLNYQSVQWSRRAGTIEGNMSDLPIITNDV